MCNMYNFFVTAEVQNVLSKKVRVYLKPGLEGDP